MVTVIPGHERSRTGVNAEAHTWKACWVQALASSNLASSATANLRRRGWIMVAGCAISHTPRLIFCLRLSSRHMPYSGQIGVVAR
jgi:hypothetical protein